MKRALIAIVAVLAIVPAASHAADPSEGCATGFVPPSTTPAGAGARVSTEPLEATVTACNDGSVVPMPGSARANVDATHGSALVVADGDPTSSVLGCSDGYVAAGASSEGPKLYENADGGYTSRARPKSPDEFAGDLAADCAPPAPAAA